MRLDVIEFGLYRAWDELGQPQDTVLVSGACPRGADHMAEIVWYRQGMHVERHPALWKVHGRKAGMLRNQFMVDKGADICVAFMRDNSAGTSHCIKAAVEAGIPVRLYETSDPLGKDIVYSER